MAMVIKKETQKRMTVIDNLIVDLSLMDKDDMNAILKHKGLVPLSKEERLYLDAIHTGLMSTNLLLNNIVPIVEDNDKIDKNQKSIIIADIKSKIEENDNLLSVSIQDVGHGYVFKREEY